MRTGEGEEWPRVSSLRSQPCDRGENTMASGNMFTSACEHARGVKQYTTSRRKGIQKCSTNQEHQPTSILKAKEIGNEENTDLKSRSDGQRPDSDSSVLQEQLAKSVADCRACCLRWREARAR